jgi:pSer/pThr/pTyr-binding forkhead associated (FHA) protein
LGSDVVVADLRSTNGTKVNGAPVTERVLEDGDEITVGTTTLRFETS